MEDNSTNCYGNESAVIFKVYAGINMAMGLVACVFGLFTVISLLLLNKHLFYNQRLLIYLNSSNIFGGLVSMASVNPFLSDGLPTNSIYCTINAFFFNSFVLTQLLIIWWIALDGFRPYLFTRNILYPSFGLEVTLLVLVFALPPLVLWIPAIPGVGLYGPDGPLCDIQALNYTTCEPITNGYIGLSVYLFLPILVTIFLLPILLIVGKRKMQKDEHKFESANPQTREIMVVRKEVWQLQVYPLIYLIFIIPSVIHYIVAGIGIISNDVKKIVLATYFFYIVCNNVRGITLSFVYVFGRKKLDMSFQNMRHRIKTNFRRNDIIKSYNTSKGNLYLSYGDSLDGKEIKAKNLTRSMTSITLTENLLDS